MRRLFGVILVVSWLAGTPVWAMPTLDQHQEDENGATTAHAGVTTRWIGQTFTAGISGLLDHIDIGNTYGMTALPAVAPLVQIRNTVNDMPGNTILGGIFLTHALSNNGWTTINFLTQDITLTAGETYTIVIYPRSSGKTTVGFNNDPTSYANGALYEYNSSTWRINSTGGEGDIQFRIYVDSLSTVPAPAAVLLGGFGTACVTWLRRRRTF